jgi:hypothetical protein
MLNSYDFEELLFTVYRKQTTCSSYCIITFRHK